MLSINVEPNHTSFERLLQECFRISDSFSLTPPRKDALSASGIDLLQCLSPYKIGTIKTHRWFSNYAPPWEKSGMQVFVFRSCKETQKILMERYQHLFFTDPKAEWYNLQDLCFFIDKVLFMGTLSHENICFFYPLYPPNEAVEASVRRICPWEDKPDSFTEWINYENMIMLTE